LTACVGTGSRVRFRPLEERRDGDGWVIGRIETGVFISVPETGHRVITLLRAGRAIDEAAALLRSETGRVFAVADFITTLDELGFVAAVDDQDREDSAIVRPSLPWLRPGHVRWLLNPGAPWVAACFAAAVIIVLATHPELIPSSRVLVWSRYAGLVLVVNAVITWTLILVHEVAHLCVARAAGVPARITLSTRLQFLVAQTDVSGIWAQPRRVRMTVYLSGMAADVCVACTCLLIVVLANPHGIARQLLMVAVAGTLLVLPAQFMIFLRTDLYFVLQDLTGCANLYADGSAYLRYLARVFTRGRPGRRAVIPDPSRDYQPSQRIAVRVYSAVLLIGTVTCLAIEFAITVPALVLIIARAVSEIGTTVITSIDGCAALAIVVGWQVLWASRWWHRHQSQARVFASRYLGGRREVTHA
jgi:putative peptide zinc metalloprotease protein